MSSNYSLYTILISQQCRNERAYFFYAVQTGSDDFLTDAKKFRGYLLDSDFIPSNYFIVHWFAAAGFILGYMPY